jgi:hypothetical protein
LQIKVQMIEVQMIEVQIEVQMIEVQMIEVQMKPAWKEFLVLQIILGHCLLDFDEQQGAPLQAALDARLGDAVVGITHDRNESVEHDDRDEQHGDHQQVGQHVPNCETSPAQGANTPQRQTHGETQGGVSGASADLGRVHARPHRPRT